MLRGERASRRDPFVAAACNGRGASLALLTCGLAAALLVSAALPPPVRLLWNASPSMAEGLYGVSGRGALRRGDIVMARLPSGVARIAAGRGYLPRGVPMIKRVAALPGDMVCFQDDGLWIEGVRAATSRQRDAAGRAMPRARGCGLLMPGMALLLGDTSDSFDSRYFGAISQILILGKARALWLP
jgi:conjugative transfer signal peptidase TraF